MKRFEFCMSLPKLKDIVRLEVKLATDFVM